MTPDPSPSAIVSDDLALATVTDETLSEALHDLAAGLRQWLDTGAAEDCDIDDITDAGALVLHRLRIAVDAVAALTTAAPPPPATPSQ
jgi:hypothetical protein